MKAPVSPGGGGGGGGGGLLISRPSRGGAGTIERGGIFNEYEELCFLRCLKHIIIIFIVFKNKYRLGYNHISY